MLAIPYWWFGRPGFGRGLIWPVARPVGRWISVCLRPLTTTLSLVPLPLCLVLQEGAHQQSAVRAASTPQFVDETRRAGVTFRNATGSPEKRYVIETQSAGVGLWDYDMDGSLDIFFTNGAPLEDTEPSRALEGNALYHNDGDGLFEDVTSQAGVGGVSAWSMGCTVADYDNDGDPDLYVTRWGANTLYRNEGNGSFVDVTDVAGVGDDSWGVGSSFGDYDGDGHVDLYVANYIDFRLHGPPYYDRWCVYNGIPAACGPAGFEATPDVLYHNGGDGRFTDVSDMAGIRGRSHYGMGVAWGDLDDDSDLDLYVANDGHPNSLFRNEGSGRFVDVALLSGTAYSGTGRPQAGMGVALGDYDNDGDLDIFVTNFSQDHNTLYRNDGDDIFADVTGAVGMAGPSRPFMGWGTFFFDFDNDGNQDVFVANGHLMPAIDRAGVDLGYRQRNLLFRNTGRGRFEDVSRAAGPGLTVEKVSRGAAYGDYDNDGDLDVVVANLDDTPTLLRNDGGHVGNWLIMKLQGTASSRDGIGARVRVVSDEMADQLREVNSGSSFQSQSDSRVHFGLGQAGEVQIEVRWPNGALQILEEVSVNSQLTIREEP